MDLSSQRQNNELDNPSPIIKRAFGSANRNRLLRQWFDSRPQLHPASAWQDVYRLLLWVDRTTGLAHCYESDKSQPGKHWYGRTLAFHAWVARGLDTTPANLGGEIDWLFRRVISDLSMGIEAQRQRILTVASSQRAPYEGEGMPEPGEDPELVELLKRELSEFLMSQPNSDAWRLLTQRIHAHLGQENKRRNLVGEGFEDLLAEMLARLLQNPHVEISTRRTLDQLPGFHPRRGSEKPKKVDLAVVNKSEMKRTLVTAKWSIRADREEQFATDYEAYERLEAAGTQFDYVLITNEFDPARLLASCAKRAGNQSLFSAVVHVSPGGLLAAYGENPKGSADEVRNQIEAGRLTGLDTWLGNMQSTYV